MEVAVAEVFSAIDANSNGFVPYCMLTLASDVDPNKNISAVHDIRPMYLESYLQMVVSDIYFVALD